MSKPSVFEKKRDEDDMINDVSGVLDQFNLPPAFIEYVRKNKKIIQLLLAVTVILVVFISLYGSYREKRIDQAAQALSLAAAQNDDKKIPELEQVIRDYSSTTSAVWAEVEIAHAKMKKGQYPEAAAIYRQIGEKAGKKNPLYALAMLGAAQADEAAGNLAEAVSGYEKIKVIPGYQLLGFAGLARIYEVKGEQGKAFDAYKMYLGELTEYPDSHPEKIFVEEKIARLKPAGK